MDLPSDVNANENAPFYNNNNDKSPKNILYESSVGKIENIQEQRHCGSTAEEEMKSELVNFQEVKPPNVKKRRDVYGLYNQLQLIEFTSKFDSRPKHKEQVYKTRNICCDKNFICKLRSLSFKDQHGVDENKLVWSESFDAVDKTDKKTNMGKIETNRAEKRRCSDYIEAASECFKRPYRMEAVTTETSDIEALEDLCKENINKFNDECMKKAHDDHEDVLFTSKNDGYSVSCDNELKVTNPLFNDENTMPYDEDLITTRDTTDEDLITTRDTTDEDLITTRDTTDEDLITTKDTTDTSSIREALLKVNIKEPVHSSPNQTYNITQNKSHTFRYPCIQLSLDQQVLDRSLEEQVNVESISFREAKRNLISLQHVNKNLQERRIAFPVDDKLRSVDEDVLKSLCLQPAKPAENVYNTLESNTHSNMLTDGGVDSTAHNTLDPKVLETVALNVSDVQRVAVKKIKSKNRRRRSESIVVTAVKKLCFKKKKSTKVFDILFFHRTLLSFHITLLNSIQGF